MHGAPHDLQRLQVSPVQFGLNLRSCEAMARPLPDLPQQVVDDLRRGEDLAARRGWAEVGGGTNSPYPIPCNSG